MERKASTPSLTERIEEFSNKVRERAEGEYPPEMVEEFLDYWTESNEGGKKFRAEKEKTWDTGKRLARWFRNSRGKYNKIDRNDRYEKAKRELGL